MRPMDIDPTFLPYLRQVVAERTQSLDQVNIAERRARTAAARAHIVRAVNADVDVGWTTIRTSGGATRVLICRPKGSLTTPAVLYCHGGGWMYGSPEQSAELALLYVRQVGVTVVSPEYRLSPEHPFPSGFNDCYDTLSWIASEGQSIGIDPSRIAVSGESSGANLAASCALAARDRKGPRIILQVLNYPALGIDFETQSYTENADAPILSRAEMIFFWKAYLAGSVERVPCYAAPLISKSVVGLPPAHIIVAEYDPLRDDGVSYAHRLRADGVHVDLRHARRLPHGFFRALSISSDVREMALAVCNSLRAALWASRK